MKIKMREEIILILMTHKCHITHNTGSQMENVTIDERNTVNEHKRRKDKKTAKLEELYISAVIQDVTSQNIEELHHHKGVKSTVLAL